MPLAVGTALVTALFLARVASAAGVNLAWNACSAEGGVQSKTFACNSNSGSQSALASFSLDDAESTFVGVEAVVDVQADADSLPNWWKF